MSPQRPPTSERVSDAPYHRTLNEHLVYCMHVATYEFARQFVSGARVLDFGCGTGYGAEMLSKDVVHIEGVDISSAAIEEATGRATSPNTTFRRVPPIEQAPLPHADDAFDVVLSFQVIEHVPRIDTYLSEVRRVLRPGGTFVCATPDRSVRLYRRQRPWNVFHVREFSPDEMLLHMRTRFDQVELLGMTSSPPHLLQAELDRYRRMRRLALPFTFPGAPERWRRTGLRGMKRIGESLAACRPTRSARAQPFGPEAITIRPGLRATPNVITVAR